MPPNQSELTPMIINMGLTHLGSEASIYMYRQMAAIILKASIGSLFEDEFQLLIFKHEFYCFNFFWLF